jgi:hypothetical protein
VTTALDWALANAPNASQSTRCVSLLITAAACTPAATVSEAPNPKGEAPTHRAPVAWVGLPGAV